MMRDFSIKDLENLSGVKAHTIRMWEQRYGLLKPERTDTNIRKYNGSDLKLLLNVSTLNRLGFRISKIVSMSDQEMTAAINESTEESSGEQHYLNILKISMLNYDEELFHNLINQFLQENEVEDVFRKLFIPFLMQIGLLWQTNSICPAQEHFMSNLMRQKLYGFLDRLEAKPARADKVFVLYLPENEFHDLGLLMFNYILKKAGFKSIYLGTSVPFADLIQLKNRVGIVHFVSFMTIDNPQQSPQRYISIIEKSFESCSCQFHLSGGAFKGISSSKIDQIHLYSSAEEMLSSLL